MMGALSSRENQQDGKINRIMVIIAMQAEAQPLIDCLGLTEQSSVFSGPLPAKCFSGLVDGCNVDVVVNGQDPKFGNDSVGTVCAALTTYEGLKTLSPDLLINAGTAGGFRRKGAEIGDIFLSTECKNHDRRIAIPSFTEWATGAYECVSTANMQKELGFKCGIVTTGNSLDHEPKDDELMLENDASVKDMEAAAIASTAALFETPFFAVKSVTDIVDGNVPTHEEFLENLSAAARSLQEAIPRIISFVVQKSSAKDL
uniref:Nucleoside phosphorylase domain-containing protein n=1 Tax=Heterosigma akashiwo TaxID=2829 RepID=A0A6S9GE08_HETAK|mmetsp:Transcript_5645/g.9125  ORF Transcript_5645/g.9125 Transcript_5645/m.9125 type:complete len:258 (-) Transcript_5645:245-1018(-)